MFGLSKEDGSKIGNAHFDIEGALSDVHGTETERLLLLNDGRCYLYRTGVKVADLATKGPVQHAVTVNGYVDSFRLERRNCDQRKRCPNKKQNEVVVQHLIKDEQVWLLTNDGVLSHSILTSSHNDRMSCGQRELPRRHQVHSWGNVQPCVRVYRLQQ